MANAKYNEIIDLIKKLDLEDDGIEMNNKIKSIRLDFCNIVKDETMLCDSMEYINDQVLNDNGDAALKFALLFSSRSFDCLSMHKTKIRYIMLDLLKTNYDLSEKYRTEDKNRLYNSITLLGEYYNKIKLADGSPIEVLGESLLSLLIREINFIDCEESPDEKIIDFKLAKLILSQVTLNGKLLNRVHKDELDQLLFYIRKNLIEKEHLEGSVKALLLMTLDLYYSNFQSLTATLEEMYLKYLAEESKEKIIIDSSPENKPSTKSWSEQVTEELSSNDSNCDSKNYDQEEQSLPIHTSRNYESPPAYYYYSGNLHGSNQKLNRSSMQCDDDSNGVRSDNESIRLYSVDGRWCQAQIEINQWEGNSNTGYQTFNGNNHKSNSRNSCYNENYNKNINPRNSYDRPPRFHNSEACRNNNNGYQNERPNLCGPDSRSSSKNRTLPQYAIRPISNYDYGGYLKSVSPESNRNFNHPFLQNRPQQSRDFGISNRFGEE